MIEDVEHFRAKLQDEFFLQMKIPANCEIGLPGVQAPNDVPAEIALLA